MQKILTILVLGASLVLAACSTISVPGQYKIDIQQGNIISQEAVAKLKPGMSKSQIRFALGTPLLVDVFHQDRWDYIYSIQLGGQERQQRHLSVFFSDDKLIRIEGDVQPAAKGQPLVPAAGTDAPAPIPAPAAAP